MSDFIPLEQLEADPRFAKMNAQEQNETRTKWLAAVAMTNSYQKLGNDQKFALSDAVQSRAPILENKNNNSLANEWMSVADRAAQGDQMAIDRARQIHLENMVGESGGILGWLGTKLAEAAGVRDFQVAHTDSDRRDRAKAFGYFQGRTSQNDKVMDWTMSAANLGISASGLISDVLLFRGAGKLLGSAAIGLSGEGAIGKTAQTVMNWTSAATRGQMVQATAWGNRGKFILGELAPSVAGAAFDGAVLTGTQALRTDQAMKVWGTVSPQLQKQSIQVFGESVIGDIAMWTALKALKPVWLMAKMQLAKSGEFGDVPQDQLLQMMDDAMAGNDIDPSVMSRIARLQPEYHERLVTTQQQVWKKADGLDLAALADDPVMVEMMAARAGYTVGPGTSGKINIYDNEEQLMGNFDSHKEAFDFIDLTLQKIDASKSNALPTSVVLKPDALVKVQAQYSAKLSKTNQDPAVLYAAQSFTEDLTGKLDFTPFQSLNVIHPSGKQFQQVTETQFNSIKPNDNANIIYVPSTITSQATRDRIASEVIPRFGEKVDMIGGPRLQNLMENLFNKTSDVRRNSFSDSWVNSTARESGFTVTPTPQGGLQLADAAGGVRAFARKDAAAFFLLQQQGKMTDADFAAVMSHDYGLAFERAANGQVVLRQMSGFGKDSKIAAGGIVVQGKDIADLLEQRPQLTPKFPASAAPYMMIVDPTGKFVVNGRVASGTVQSMRELNEQFFHAGKDTSQTFDEALVRSVGDRQIVYGKRNDTFLVRIPDYGLELPFRDLKSATEALEGFGKNYSDLEKAAWAKDATVDTYNGKIWLRTTSDAADGKPPVQVGSIEEAATFLKSLSNVGHDAPELTGMFSSLEQVITEPHLKELLKTSYPKQSTSVFHQSDLDLIQKRHSYEGKKQPVRDFIGYITDGMDSGFRKLSTTMNDPRIYDIYDRTVNSYTLLKGKTNQMNHLISGITSKMNAKEREYAIKLISAEETEWDTIWKGLDPKRNQGGVPQNVRDAIGGFKHLLDGHKTMFGIDPWIVMKNYLPRFKEMLKKDAVGYGFDAGETTEVFFKRAMGEDLPVELKFFAENMRLQDFAEFANSVTIDEVVTRYLHRGYKKLLMGDTMKANKATFEALLEEKNLTKTQLARIHDFMEESQGMSQSTTQEMATEATQEFGNNLRTWINKIRGGDNKEASIANQDMLDLLKSMTVASTMAFRPGLVMRNLQQIYVTLGPVMDQSWVDAAMVSLQKKGVFSDLRTAIGTARDSGHLMSHISPLGELDSHTGLLAKFNKLGMKWYQDSDVVTRMVVDETMKLRMSLPMDRLLKSQRSPADLKLFMDDSGISRLDPTHQSTIMETLNTDGPAAALQKTQEIVQHFTMFSYQKFDNPAPFKGFIGKLYGTFGHYPIHYASMVKTMITNPNKGMAAAMVINMAKSAAAFYYVGEKVLGINSRNFMPWNQALFTGGPYFDLMNQMATAAPAVLQGDQSMQANMALKALPKQFYQLMMPFGMNTIGAQKTAKFLEEGDTYRAFLTAMSLPTTTPPDRSK